jgi:8-oxo-dGTP diphosphatase
MPPDPRAKVGTAAWVEHDGCLLMILRGGVGQFASDGHGTWSVPGGWLDYPEPPAVSTIREGLEETDADLVDLELPIETTWGLSDNGELSITTLWIRCRWGGLREPRVVEPDKCPVVEWVPLDEISQRPLYSSLQRYLDQYRPELIR